MNTAETIKSAQSAGGRILVLAILFSLAWHIFWLSMVKVVAAPVKAPQAGFSKVSFLGRILTRVGMEVMARQAERSLLERRYSAAFSRAGRPAERMAPPVVKYEGRTGPNRDTDGKIAYMIDAAVSGAKVEPDYGSE
jgi:hypothetical protein